MTTQNKIIASLIGIFAVFVIGVAVWRPSLIFLLSFRQNVIPRILGIENNSVGLKNLSILTSDNMNKSFSDNFVENKKIEETGKMNDSSDAHWWVNSGGSLIISSGIAKTIQSKLPMINKWRLEYAINNPTDTDNGYRPQNIFRLVQRGVWLNYVQECYFKINVNNLSNSENRNASNGLLLFNRYVDGDNLYYAGIRVDGSAVIKKKINGEYFTMDSKQIITDQEYDQEKSSNSIPLNTWIGLRSVVQTQEDNSVSIDLYADMNNTGDWKLIAQAVDDNKTFGGSAINKPGHVGMRTDFMDVEFKGYLVKEK